MERLDKYLCDAEEGSRKDVKVLIRRGKVCVNGQVVKDPTTKVDPQKDEITLFGDVIGSQTRMVCAMNKPAGFVTSTDDPRDRTVMELIPPQYIPQHLVPVGRLDKDTEGLLLFTNDGDLLHKLISPKSRLPKTYQVTFEGTRNPDDEQRFREGIVLKDGTTTQSAQIEYLDESTCLVTVTEGKYHQVKRMMAATGKHVTALRRIGFGNITLEGLEEATETTDTTETKETSEISEAQTPFRELSEQETDELEKML